MDIFLQAEQQLEGSGIEFIMYVQQEFQQLLIYRKIFLKEEVLGFDGRVVTFGEGKTLSEKAKS